MDPTTSFPVELVDWLKTQGPFAAGCIYVLWRSSRGDWLWKRELAPINDAHAKEIAAKNKELEAKDTIIAVHIARAEEYKEQAFRAQQIGHQAVSLAKEVITPSAAPGAAA